MPSIGDILPEVVDDGFTSAEAPGAAEAIAAALSSAGASDLPVPSPLESDLVELPGGVRLDDGTVVKRARVKELTGADEEAIARAAVSMNPFHFLNTLLECGVVEIGDQPKKKTKELLKRALVGDRDAMIMGIRRATYGPEIEIEEWICPECRTSSTVTLPLDDIPIRELDTFVFEVPLRKGRVATVELATGADQLAVFDNDALNIKERDSLLLARTLVSIKEADGQVNTVAGFAHGIVSSMNMGDRNKILKELLKRQPGPQFGDIKFTHDVCNKEVTFAIGIGDMFPDL
jgi:hypothetical protein